jgi:peptidase E
VAPTIVAIGGGAFSADASRVRLEDYVLGLSDKASPRVCFIPTASGDSPSMIDQFYRVFSHDRCRPTHLGLFDRRVWDLRAFLLEQDIVYVGGGNTATMLAIWRLHRLDEALREAWQAGVILSGSSAGASCWHAGTVVDSFGPTTVLADGLQLIPASLCPHYDSEVERPPLFRGAVADGVILPGLALENDVAVRYEGTEVVELVAVRREARAWRVEAGPEGVREVAVPVRYLGGE